MVIHPPDGAHITLGTTILLQHVDDEKTLNKSVWNDVEVNPMTASWSLRWSIDVRHGRVRVRVLDDVVSVYFGLGFT